MMGILRLAAHLRPPSAHEPNMPGTELPLNTTASVKGLLSQNQGAENMHGVQLGAPLICWRRIVEPVASRDKEGIMAGTTGELDGLLRWRCIGPHRGGRVVGVGGSYLCLLYTSPSPRDRTRS